MALEPVTAALELGGRLIDRLWPDPAQREAAKLKLLEMQQNGELARLTAEAELAKGQIEINKVEAQSANWFVAGWRPAAGWACVGGLSYQVLLRPLAGWAAANALHWSMPPSLEMDTLGTMLFGMLGLGAYRMTEKIKGVAS